MIIVGVTSVNPDYRFWPGFCEWYAVNRPLFNLHLKHVWRKMLHQAQTEIVEVAMASEATHVLFVEDDMTCIPEDGLRLFLEADKDVISCFTYMRQWPHYCIPLRKKVKNKKLCDFGLFPGSGLTPVGKDEKGVVRVDLVPQSFSLVKMSVFSRIGLPWFEFGEVGATDLWFSDQCAEAGIKMYAHMDVRVGHCGINDTTQPFFVAMGTEMRLKEVNGE